MVDGFSLDLIFNTVTVEGRDLSASMIDSFRQRDFVNQTGSDIVSTIASSHGLTPVVTAVQGFVGRFYGDGYTRLSLGQFSRIRSDWDLVVELARENQFDAYVSGKSLFFTAPVGAGEAPVLITPQCVITMRLDVQASLSTNSAVRVQSWNSQNYAPYISGFTNNTDATLGATSAVPMTPYLFTAANLTSSQAANNASRFGAEVERLTSVLSFELPIDLSLLPRTNVLLSGSDSAFDGTYCVDTIQISYSTTSGSRQRVRARSVG
jgi:phage protein D